MENLFSIIFPLLSNNMKYTEVEWVLVLWSDGFWWQEIVEQKWLSFWLQLIFRMQPYQ